MAKPTIHIELPRPNRLRWAIAGLVAGALLCLPAASLATSISGHQGYSHGSKGSAFGNNWFEFLSFLKNRFDEKPFSGRGNPPRFLPPGIAKRIPSTGTVPRIGRVVPPSDTRPSTALPEPSAALVFGVGCLLVGTALRKRSH